jgi:hypothetical protein
MSKRASSCCASSAASFETRVPRRLPDFAAEVTTHAVLPMSECVELPAATELHVERAGAQPRTGAGPREQRHLTAYQIDARNPPGRTLGHIGKAPLLRFAAYTDSVRRLQEVP